MATAQNKRSLVKADIGKASKDFIRHVSGNARTLKFSEQKSNIIQVLFFER